MTLLYTQVADTLRPHPIPLEPMFRQNRKRRTPLKHALWFALGMAVGWVAHALLTA